MPQDKKALAQALLGRNRRQKGGEDTKNHKFWNTQPVPQNGALAMLGGGSLWMHM